MPDGGASESVVAEELMAEGAAEAAADGAVAAGTEEAAASAALESGLADLATDEAFNTVVGESIGMPAEEIAAANAAGTGTATAETVGTGPAAQTGEAVTTSNTDKLAQQVLNGPNPAANGETLPDAVMKPPPGNGIVDSMVQFADKHPLAATMAGTQIAGAVGGVGKAALEKEIAERNIRARSDLLTQQSAATLQQSRAGAVPGGGVRVQPRGGLVRRPDGSLVFAPTGIVNSNIAQGG